MLTQCPHCKARFQVSDEHKGEKARCTKCKRPFELNEYVDLLPQSRVDTLPQDIYGIVKPITASAGILSTIIGLILGVLSTAITIFIVIATVAFTGYYIHSFSLFFLIPFGALAAGALCSSGLFWGIRLTRRKAVTLHSFLALCLGALGLIGIYYGLYATAYVSSDMRINHLFEGEHISNFVYKDTEEQVTFKSYFIDGIRSRSTTFIIGIGQSRKMIPIPLGSVGLPSVLNWIDFIIEVLGFILGSFFVRIFIADTYRDSMQDGILYRTSSKLRKAFSKLKRMLLRFYE